jgi:hypothetical protein
LTSEVEEAVPLFVSLALEELLPCALKALVVDCAVAVPKFIPLASAVAFEPLLAAPWAVRAALATPRPLVEPDAVAFARLRLEPIAVIEASDRASPRLAAVETAFERLPKPPPDVLVSEVAPDVVPPEVPSLTAVESARESVAVPPTANVAGPLTGHPSHTRAKPKALPDAVALQASPGSRPAPQLGENTPSPSAKAWAVAIPSA